ncbi:MAG: phospholipid carrier-dependent glycosyltransferase [Gammaproteobacteria bacterium]
MRTLLLTLILATCGLVASTWHYFGHSWDEPEHLAAGMELLDHGHYEYDLQHPPLARLLIALGPWLDGARSHGTPPPDGVVEGLAILYGGGHYDRDLTLARLGVLPFLAVLLVATWLWGRRLVPASQPALALVATALVASTPPVLGHAGLATLDVAAAGTCLLALYALQTWFTGPTWRQALVAGLACGVAVATKLSAIPFLAVGVVAFAVINTKPLRVVSWRGLSHGAAALAVVGVVLTLVYGGRFLYFTDATGRYDQALTYLFGTSGRAHDLAYAVAARVPLPEALRLLIGGIQALTMHNQAGHLSFLLGETRTTGWWYFYPVALATKLPLPLLVLGLAGLGGLAVTGWRQRNAWQLAPPLLFVAILAFCCTVSHINVGVRHVLIEVPLLALGAGWLLQSLWHALTTASLPRSRLAVAAGCAALCAPLAWQLATLVSAYPDYLPYFNEAVRHPEGVLVDSDLDWGQDLKRLEQRLAELGIPHVALAYRGTADLGREPLPAFTTLAPGQPTDGWIAISALARAKDPQGYAWLLQFHPVERIGKTIDLYRIPAGHGRVSGQRR